MIVVNLDVMMAKRKIGLGELAEKIDLTPANLSILKNNKAKAVRFTTLNAICTAPVLGGLTILLVCAGAGCLGGYAAIGSYLEPDGTLTEPFFLVPLFWLCMLGALCAFLLFTAAALSARSLKGK